MAAQAKDNVRDQSATAIETANSGGSAAPKAWTTGTNPITQRRTVSPATNGVANGHGQEQGKPGLRESQTHDKHAHDRLMFLLSNFIGLDANLALKNGDRYTGVFSGATTQQGEARYNLKMVRKLSSAPTNGTASTDHLVGEGEDFAMAFDVNDTLDLSVAGLSFGSSQARAANGSAFRTDTEISGHLDMRERTLQRWEPGPDDKVDLSLGGNDGLGHGTWDQFAANEKLYNVRSDYNEDLYTTSIDKTNPQYKQRLAEAERIAREIESKAVVQADSGLDEEDKYSGVRRDAPTLGKSGANAYIPPSKRGSTAQTTAPDASLKPAVAVPSQVRSSSMSAESTKDKQDAEHTGDGTGSTNIKGTLAKAIGSVTPNASSMSKSPADGSDNYIKDAAVAFKQWSQPEKLRVQAQRTQQQAQKATTARQEKSVKLNDLKKFSQNFKLNSRVPEDLVPILAKSKEKQDEIIKKADQQAREKEVQKVTGATPPPKGSKPESGPPTHTSTTPVNPADSSTRARSQQQAGKPPIPAVQPPRAPSNADQRQPPSRVPSAATASPASAAVPPPTVPAVQPGSRVLSPPSASSMRFNAAAMEFKPNPAASSFNPGASVSEAAGSKRPSITSPALIPAKQVAPAEFFTPESKKSKLAEAGLDKIQDNDLLSVTVLHTRTQADETKKSQFALTGGIPQGYRTAPVWDAIDANAEKSYNDSFSNSIQPSPSPIHALQNGIIPHQHQLPLHLQNGGPGHQFYRGQTHPMGGHHMEHFGSNPSSVQPSPRMAQSPMMYNGQVTPQMGAYPFGMPPGGMSPAMAMRAMPVGGPYMHSGVPMGGQMMSPQPSSGPYAAHLGQQQMQMYPSPVPSHVQPHFGGQPGMPGAYGGSPRGIPMSQQGSQQGTPQPMFMGGQMMMMPHGGPGPVRGYSQGQFGAQHQQGAYGMQHRAMSNGQYSQHVTPRQQHASPHQQPAQATAVPPPATNGEESR